MGLKSTLEGNEPRYCIDSTGRKLYLHRTTDRDVIANKNRYVEEFLQSISIDGSEQFGPGDYISYNMTGEVSEYPYVIKVASIKHSITPVGYDGTHSLGYCESVGITTEDVVSEHIMGRDTYYVSSNRMINVKLVGEQEYVDYRKLDDQKCFEYTLSRYKYKVECCVKKCPSILQLDDVGIRAVTTQLVMAYEDPTEEDIQREIQNCANGLYEGVPAVDPARNVWRLHLYPELKRRATSAGIDPQELVKQLTEYLKEYLDNEEG
jgi:hypothetical protein